MRASAQCGPFLLTEAVLFYFTPNCLQDSVQHRCTEAGLPHQQHCSFPLVLSGNLGVCGWCQKTGNVLERPSSSSVSPLKSTLFKDPIPILKTDPMPLRRLVLPPWLGTTARSPGGGMPLLPEECQSGGFQAGTSDGLLLLWLGFHKYCKGEEQEVLRNFALECFAHANLHRRDSFQIHPHHT